MKRTIVLLCLLAIVALWAWALFWPKPVGTLPETYRGTFMLYRFEPPPGQTMANPYPPGQEREFTFREDGTYTVRVLLSGGYEMMRFEGSVEATEDEVVTLTQLSENRSEIDPVPESFKASWGNDSEGRFLLFTGIPSPYQLYLRPAPRHLSDNSGE